MLAIVNGRVLTITGGIIDPGTVLIDGEKIVEIGPNLPAPPGAEVIDAGDCWVLPGLIDAHSHLGLFGEPWVWAHEDGNEMTDPVTPHMRGIDSVNPSDPSFADALAAGVTTVYTGPGSGNIIGGTGIAIKTCGRTVDELVYPGTEGMKMALGENPKRVHGEDNKRLPSTRMGNAAVLREALVRAQNYLGRFAQAEAEAQSEPGKPIKFTDRDLKYEALARVLRREMKVRIHCHRADDILTAVRVAEEFNLDLSLEHATEGYLVADILAAKGVPCVVGPTLIPRSKMELNQISLKNPGVLARAGVKVAIQMDGSSETQFLPLAAGVAVREGMPEEDAFKAITINAAEIIGLDDRVGSLEKGKDADVAIFDGHPFNTMTKCVKVILKGRVAFSR